MLSKPVRQPLPYQAREHVGRATGWKANDDVHWARRIIDRRGVARQSRKYGSTYRQLKESPAGNSATISIDIS